MSIVKAIENIELERENNRALRDAFRNRMENLLGTIGNLNSQAQVLEEMLTMLRTDVAKARDAMMQEMDNRDEALRVIIEGDANAQR